MTTNQSCIKETFAHERALLKCVWMLCCPGLMFRKGRLCHDSVLSDVPMNLACLGCRMSCPEQPHSSQPLWRERMHSCSTTPLASHWRSHRRQPAPAAWRYTASPGCRGILTGKGTPCKQGIAFIGSLATRGFCASMLVIDVRCSAEEVVHAPLRRSFPDTRRYDPRLAVVPQKLRVVTFLVIHQWPCCKHLHVCLVGPNVHAFELLS